jgi:flagellar assembly protein FliH
LSSESAAATVAAYTFRQLEAPLGGSIHDAADVLSAAHAEADQIRERARAAGEAEGRASGLAAIRAELEPSLQALAAATAQVSALRAELTAALEHDAVRLAVRIAEQVVAGTIDVQPQRIVDIAGLALRRIAERRQVTLVVNPADLELLTEAAGDLRASLGGVDELSVQSDRRVARGGALARTEIGEIDASLDTQLARVRELIADELADAAASVPAAGEATAEDVDGDVVGGA